MIPGVELIDFITWAGLVGITFIVFAESGLLVGFFLPGDSLLFTAGFLAYAGVLDVNIHVMVASLFVAAVAGDSVGYWFGRKAGPRLFAKKDSRFFKQEYVHKAQLFYEKHGGKTIILARFMPIIRTFAPIVAGVGKMNYRRFVSFNVIGGLVWTTSVTYLGYYLGSWLESVGIHIEQIMIPMVLAIVAASVAPPIIHVMRDEKNRKSLWALAKKQLNYLGIKLK